MHPGNWSTTQNVDWRVYNDSEVAIQSSMIPYVTRGTEKGSNPSDRLGAFSLSALPRVELVAGSTHFPGGTVALGTGTGSAASLQSLNINGSFNYRFSILGYTTSPENRPLRPATTATAHLGLQNNNTRITAASPIIEYRAITGNNGSGNIATDPVITNNLHPSINVSALWRTVRINADGFAAQLD